jgi:hypothetical protein
MRLLPITAMTVACFVSATAMAKDYKVGSMQIISPWSRATPKGASTAIGYMAIKNDGTTTDRLIGGSIDVADGFQLHSMTMENGVAKMHELKSVEIKPGQTVELKPGGSHVMFVKLKSALSKGERVKGTVVFEQAGTVQIEYNVEGIGAQSGPQEMEDMKHQQ